MVSCIRYHGSMWSGYFRLVKKIFSSNQILCILEVIVLGTSRYSYSLCTTERDNVIRILTPVFFHDSNPTGSIIHMLKYLHIWFKLRRDIRVCKKLQFKSDLYKFFSFLKRKFTKILTLLFHD